MVFAGDSSDSRVNGARRAPNMPWRVRTTGTNQLSSTSIALIACDASNAPARPRRDRFAFVDDDVIVYCARRVASASLSREPRRAADSAAALVIWTQELESLQRTDAELEGRRRRYFRCRPAFHVWRLTMAEGIFDKVEKVYDQRRHAVHDLSWEIRDGDSWWLVGPSGCGKTTARAWWRLEEITDGRVSIGGRVVNDLTRRNSTSQWSSKITALSHSRCPTTSLRAATAQDAEERVEERVAWQPSSSPDAILNRRPKELSVGTPSGSQWAQRSCASLRCS